MQGKFMYRIVTQKFQFHKDSCTLHITFKDLTLDFEMLHIDINNIKIEKLG